jgi:mannosyl-oligosaccharide alpha-1,2-mannosidase
MLASIVGLLAAQAAAVSASVASVTGTKAGPAAPAPTALYPGPANSSVPSGPHPPFTWPPAGSPSPICASVQYKFPSGTNFNTTRADAVRDLYQASWEQYATYCFGSDQINTLDNTCEDDIFGWGATIVDGIDTAIIMNLTDIVEMQLAWIAQVDFTYAVFPVRDLNGS